MGFLLKTKLYPYLICVAAQAYEHLLLGLYFLEYFTIRFCLLCT